MQTLRSIWTWVSTAVLVLVWLPLLAVSRLFERDPALYRTGRLFRILGDLLTRANGQWTIHREGGVEDPRHPYVVVSNHQSLADIPVICRFPWEMKWVGKAELFEIPIVGWMMRLSGDIQVDRADKKSRAQVLVTAGDYLQKRCSVIFFPEGTRSRDGRVMRFANGPFRLAIKNQVPVLPIAVDGTQDALPKHDWRMGEPSYIHLKALDPIDTTGLTADDVDELRARVRRKIIEQIAAWRGCDPDEVDSLIPLPEDVKS